MNTLLTTIIQSVTGTSGIVDVPCPRAGYLVGIEYSVNGASGAAGTIDVLVGPTSELSPASTGLSTQKIIFGKQVLCDNARPGFITGFAPMSYRVGSSQILKMYVAGSAGVTANFIVTFHWAGL